MRNTRFTKFLMIFGERISLSDAAEKYGINPMTLYWRVFKFGWDHERAVNTKPLKVHPIELDGETLSVPKFAKKHGLSVSLVYRRLRRGCSVEQLAKPATHGNQWGPSEKDEQ